MGNSQKRRKHLQHLQQAQNLRLQTSTDTSSTVAYQYRPLVPSTLRNQVEFTPPSSAESGASPKRMITPTSITSVKSATTVNECMPSLKKTNTHGRVNKDKKRYKSLRLSKKTAADGSTSGSSKLSRKSQSMMDKARTFLQTFTKRQIGKVPREHVDGHMVDVQLLEAPPTTITSQDGSLDQPQSHTTIISQDIHTDPVNEQNSMLNTPSQYNSSVDVR